MSIRTAIESIPSDQGNAYIQKYFSPEAPYAGAFFETLGAEDSPDNVYTPSDFYALMCLEVDVPIAAGLSILGNDAETIRELLAQIPNTPLGSLTKAEFEQHLGPDSSAMQLWRILRSYKGIGATRASKLMARKRPHLIPIRDSVIQRVADFDRRDDDWLLWWEALTQDDELEHRAQELRDAAQRQHLSTLRTLDVLLWMSGSKKNSG